MNSKLLRASEVALILGSSKQRVYDLIRQKLLPSIALGRHVRVSEAQLIEWLENGGKALPGGWRRDAK